MIEIKKTGKIEGEGGSINLNGKILKIGVITNRVMTNVRIKISTFLDEILIDDNLPQEKNVFYPRISIDGDPSLNNLDYFYLAGQVNIFVEGLGEGEIIEDILFYLE